MDEHEFRRLLQQFPIVRSRNYCADSERESSSHPGKDEAEEWDDLWNKIEKEEESEEINHEDQFWQKLRSVAEKKVGPEKAEKFCSAFQTVHKQLVFEKLSIDAAQKYVAAQENRHD